MLEKDFRNEDIDDILFQNRNKKYGSYLLRKNYNKWLRISFIITLSGLLLILLLPYLVSLFQKDTTLDNPQVQIEEVPTQINEAPNISPMNNPPPKIEETKATPTDIDSTPAQEKEKTDSSKTSSRPQVGKPDSLGSGEKKGTAGSGTDTGKALFMTDYLPSFPGGVDQMKTFLRNNIKYQPSMLPMYSSTVIITVIVEKDGRLTFVNLATTSPISKELQAEATRVVKIMPRWYPGMDSKRNPVRIFVKIPIVFPRKP